ncbi:MAG: hypothetical protein SynsKO_34820 [Synoicihabitans sp.]
MSAATQEIPFTFAGVDRPGTVPAWARGYSVTRSTVSELSSASKLPEIAIVQSADPRKFIEASDLVSKFLERVCLVHLTTRLILGFRKAEAEEFLDLAPLLAKYPGLAGRVELVGKTSELHGALLEAMTKVLATRSERDPLAEVPSVAQVERRLRAPSGRLDATRIAETFGFSTAELARQIGSNRQRLSKTPDSQAIQVLLRPYVRIARLRTVLSDTEFKAWLNTPNEHLEDEDAPIDYLKARAQKPLAAVAENMLTGAPS